MRVSLLFLLVGEVFISLSNVEGYVGTAASLGDFPWHAALYRSENGEKLQQICGATLLHPRVIITAAHCVQHHSGKTFQPQELMVKLGQLQADYYTNESSTILAQVKQIVVPERYIGVANNFALDVALIELTDDVKVSDKVRPTRLDWQAKVNLQNGRQLKIAGWNEETTSLFWTDLKYLEYKECLKKLSSASTRLLSFDKFCIDPNGEKNLSRFSGGSVSVVEDGLDYAIGILTIKFSGREPVGQLFAGTNVTTAEHRNWLQDQLKRINLLDETLNWSSSTEYKAPVDDISL